MDMVTAKSQTITVEDKPLALIMMNQAYKDGGLFVSTMDLEDNGEQGRGFAVVAAELRSLPIGNRRPAASKRAPKS